jgi:preprotein translocase subunit SecA
VLIEVHLGPVTDEWDIEGLARSVLAMGIEGPDTDAEGLAGQGSREGIVEALHDAADAQLEEREKEHGPDVWAMVERLVLLRTIDSLWVDHLTELDDFRRGVGLRGYGGTDPLNEFKREAFQLYEELRGFIRHQVASTIFRVSVQRQEPPPPQQMRMPSPAELAQIRAAAGSTNGDAGNGASRKGAATPVAAGSSAISTAERSSAGAAATLGTGAAATTGALLPGLGSRRPGQVRLQRGDEAVDGSQAPAHAAKLGRNDPCWCGSGKKFKKCHGA